MKLREYRNNLYYYAMIQIKRTKFIVCKINL